ncbi:hypothetical protein [Luedemannella helvata]|uniref:Uncharacterized protein n=1 Tax=Luedemannella helvata TaxID=349315 RepID=A0ABN2JRU4_9ACTN
MSSTYGGQGGDGVYHVGPYGGLRDWLSLHRVVAGLVALAAVATIPFGGLNKADAGRYGGLARVEVGQAYDAGPWRVTVTGGRLLKDQPPLRAKKKTNRWVIVLATVEVTADETRNDTLDILRISGAEKLAGDEPDTIMLRSDYSLLPALHPGLPEQLIFGWEQDATAAVPASIDVIIWGKTLRMNSLTESEEWLDHGERAVLTVPVQDRRNA